MRCSIRIGLVFAIVIYLSPGCAAQDIDRLAFGQTDSLVSALGPMRDSSLKSIIRSITPFCKDQACLMRAIYMWVVRYIAYDCVAEKHRQHANSSASYVFATRMGESTGFAGLIAEMCRIAGITCEIVDGLAKSDPGDIGHVDNEDNAHYWNVANAKGRWFALDAAWGAGSCEGRQFTRDITDAWFLTNRKLFALCHYPRDKRFQLLDTPVERSVFVAAPIVRPLAPIIVLLPLPGQRGLLRGRQDSSAKASFIIRRNQHVIRTATVVDGVRKDIPFAMAGDTLTVAIPFIKAGKYPIILLVDTEFVVNGGPAFVFQAEVSPRPVRRTEK